MNKLTKRELADVMEDVIVEYAKNKYDADLFFATISDIELRVLNNLARHLDTDDIEVGADNAGQVCIYVGRKRRRQVQ